MAPSEKDPRERAQEYSETAGKPPPPRSRTKGEDEWRDAVSEAIEKAMRDGHFDRLPGHGKPLNLERDPFTPEGYEMAYGILRNNDLAPGWIGARNELLREIERWRLRVRAIVGRYAQELAGASHSPDEVTRTRWQKQRLAFQAEVDALNKRIRDLNLQQPISRLEIFMLRLDEEVGLAGAPESLRNVDK